MAKEVRCLRRYGGGMRVIEKKVDESKMKGLLKPIKVSDISQPLQSTNIDELKKLLKSALEQTEQLELTLKRINEFELNIKSQVDD